MGVTLSYSGLGGKVKFSGTSGRFKTVYTKPLLLNVYPGAAAAYSLRKLRSTYTGFAIRVRRSSDNTETDIGFDSSDGLDTTSLTSFVGAGSGFVTTWYDQSGNGRNVTQTTVGYQPSIVSSGTVLLFGSKPSLYFSPIVGALETKAMSNSSFTLAQPNTYFILTQGTSTNTTGDRNIFDGTGANRNAIGKSNLNSNYFLYAGTLVYSTTPVDTIKNLFVPIFNTTSSFLYKNGNAILSNANPGAQSLQGLRIGAYQENQAHWESYIPEFIVYNSNQSTNRTAIESNINSYYSIYTPTWQGTGTALLDLYPSAAAAYSLRNLSSTYTGPLVRVRRSSDNTEQDIYGTLAGQLDTASLLSFVGAGNGFISKWYDQSGNARDLVQVTTTIQPKIVNSGTVYTTNGKPSVYLLGGKVDFPTGFLNGTTNVSIQMVINIDNGATDNIGLLGPQTTYNQGIEILSLSNFGNRTALRLNGTLRNNNSAEAYQLWNDNTQTLTEIYANTSSTSAYKNNSAVTLTDSSATPALNFNGVYDLGQYGGALAAANNGYIQEFVIYTSNQVASRSGIATNINSYYTIY